MEKKSIAKNYFFNLIYQLLTILTPLITTPYVARVLGVENNGIYGYTLSIVTYFLLFGSMGTNMYGQREIAYVQDDKEKRSKVFWEIMSVKLLSYFTAILIFVLVFCINNDYALFYRILILELVANFLDISWFFQGIEDFKKTVIRNLIVKLAGLFFIFALVKSEGDLWKFFLIYGLADFLGNATLWLYVPKYVGIIKKKLNIKKHVKPILMLFLPQIAIQIYTVLDKTMIGKLTNSMVDVAYYDQAQKIIKALLLIVCALSAVMCSRIANSYAKKEHKQIKEYIEQSITVVWLIASPILFGILAVSNLFVGIYFGPGYEPVAMLMNISTLLLVAIGLNNVTGLQYLIQVKKQKEFTISVIVGALVNVILNFILINLYGTIGATISSVIAEFTILFVHVIFFTKDSISFIDLIKNSYKYIIASVIMYICLICLNNIIPQNIIGLLLDVVIGAVVYLISLIILRAEFVINIIIKLLEKVTIVY